MRQAYIEALDSLCYIIILISIFMALVRMQYPRHILIHFLLHFRRPFQSGDMVLLHSQPQDIPLNL